MSKNKWPDDKTKNFIAVYIQQTALWDSSDPDYTNKPKKDKCYQLIQKEFNLSLVEVKNKIRIYRTTYGQELKKLQATGVPPKLFWFKDLHKAFGKGKIKSFRKSGCKKNVKEDEDKMIVIDYQNDDDPSENDEPQELKYNSKKILKTQDTSDSEHHIIIEHMDEIDYEEEEYQEDPVATPPVKKSFSVKDLNGSTSSTRASASFTSNPMGSNELFLKSLVSMMDKLPEDKNMRARIKIQEVLYKIAYD